MYLSEVSDFGGTYRQLAVDRSALTDVQDALNAILTMMDDSDFEYMATIQQTSFGGTTPATTLAYHHGLAHQVMNDVLKGIKKDIEAFLTNVNKAAEVVEGVDADANAALKKKHDVLLNALNNLDHHSSGDAAYNHGRNHLHNPWADPPGGAPATGGQGGRRAI